MYEDDIQFLGVSKPLAAPSVKPVTGFALHIERNGHEPEQRMMFRKINTNTVVVGRKPPSPNLIDSSDDTKAMFRCPVVSRSHAKFTFSDSGFLYITDTSSHHGTFVGHKIIPSEILVQVNDGDTITFGKSVNRNNEVVRPVVARIELIYQTPPRTPVSLAKPSTSGRYGLRLSNTSEEDDSSQSESSIEVSGFSDQSSDHESDIVEIPPPLAAISSVVRSYISSASTSSNVPSSSKNNLDPLSVPSLFSPSPALSDAEADRQVDGTVNQLDADIFDFGSPLPLKKSWYSARARQDQSSFSQRSEGRSKSLFGRLSDERESKRDNIHRTMRRSIMTSARRKRTGGSKSRSRSNSPMDLETPSPPSPMTKILVNSHSSSATDNSNGIRFSPPLIDLVSSLSSPPSPNPVVLDPLASNLILSPLNTPPPLPPTDFVNPIEPALPTSSQSSAAPIVGSSEVESFFAGHAEEGDVAAPDSCDVPRIAGAAPQTEPSEGSQDKQSEQEKPKDLADVFSSAWHVSVSPTSLHQHEGRTFGEAQNSSLPSMSQDKSPFSKVWVDTFTSAFRTAVSPPSLPQNEGRQEMEEHTSGDAQSSFPSLQLDIEDAVRSAFATSPPSSPSNEGRQEMDERTFSEAQTSSPSIAHSGEQAQDSDSGGRGVSVTVRSHSLFAAIALTAETLAD
jgi:pSer/pThr/pTyr-binding forkhead associated (FHA) protein